MFYSLPAKTFAVVSVLEQKWGRRTKAAFVPILSRAKKGADQRSLILPFISLISLGRKNRSIVAAPIQEPYAIQRSLMEVLKPSYPSYKVT